MSGDLQAVKQWNDQAQEREQDGKFISSYTPEMGDQICHRLSSGDSMKTICKDEGMPNASTVFRWLREHPDFERNYNRAKQECADALVEEMLEIADDSRNDWMERNGQGDKGWEFNGDNVQRSRVRIDTRKWIAAKLKPKKYGDHIDHVVGGSPDGAPIQMEGIVRLVRPMIPILSSQPVIDGGSGAES